MSKMKRYLVFAGSTFYPEGGMEDLSANHDTLSKAVSDAFFCMRNKDWCHIYDTASMSVVYDFFSYSNYTKMECASAGDILKFKHSEGTCNIIQTY